MAGKGKSGTVPGEEYSPLLLHGMFRIVGSQLNEREVRLLQPFLRVVKADVDICCALDGYSFLLALEKAGRVDETNLKYLAGILRLINRHDLLQFLSLRRRKTVTTDPVAMYLEESVKQGRPPKPRFLECGAGPRLNKFLQNSSPTSVPSSLPPPNLLPSTSGMPVQNQLSTTTTSTKRQLLEENDNTREVLASDGKIWRKRRKMAHAAGHVTDDRIQCAKTGHVTDDRIQCAKTEEPKLLEKQLEEIKKKLTCDIQLRVRAEHYQTEESLLSSISSDKEDPLEHQLDRFTQANTLLKSRDLGSIICDIKFSELTYLDAFWRDYVNGSLLQALKDIFITDTLKQAVGHEVIELMVNVDEEEYDQGRHKLLKNLTD